MNSMSRRRPASVGDPLEGLRNIGPAARADLAVLGISSNELLAACDPDELYSRLQFETAHKHDPCVWDVLAAAIHQARTASPEHGGLSRVSANSGIHTFSSDLGNRTTPVVIRVRFMRRAGPTSFIAVKIPGRKRHYLNVTNFFKRSANATASTFFANGKVTSPA